MFQGMLPKVYKIKRSFEILLENRKQCLRGELERRMFPIMVLEKTFFLNLGRCFPSKPKKDYIN